MEQNPTPTIEQLLARVNELISLPEVYLKISHLMDDKWSTVGDFAEVIKFDPNLSATVLKVVNSAFYGFSGQIDSIARAVNLIGIGQLHIMALSVSAISALDAMEYPEDIVPLKTFWRSSLFTGVLSRQLALQSNKKNGERLFVTGLLHEIGHLILYTKFPDTARQAIQLAQQQHMNIADAEQQILGYHYGAIGAKLMDKWHLPDDFQNLTRFQPVPQDATEDKHEIALLHIAHGYAHKQFIETDIELEKLIHPSAWDETQISPEYIESILDSTLSISADMESIILR